MQKKKNLRYLILIKLFNHQIKTNFLIQFMNYTNLILKNHLYKQYNDHCKHLLNATKQKPINIIIEFPKIL
jgi:hypothetical protein